VLDYVFLKKKHLAGLFQETGVDCSRCRGWVLIMHVVVESFSDAASLLIEVSPLFRCREQHTSHVAD
jgi:hypothetical protein